MEGNLGKMKMLREKTSIEKSKSQSRREQAHAVGEVIEFGARKTDPIKMMEMAHCLRNIDFLDVWLAAPGERNCLSHEERYRYDLVHAGQCRDNRYTDNLGALTFWTTVLENIVGSTLKSESVRRKKNAT